MQVLSTESGSVYELDPGSRRVRRMHGTHAPTERQGTDGEWKEYQEAGTPTVGERLVIVWRTVDGIAQCTTTSRVTGITSSN